MPLKTLLLLAANLVGPCAVAATCTTAADFGSLVADPLMITAACDVSAGAVIDFGQRHVILSANLTALGDATFLAARWSQTGGQITGDADTVTIRVRAGGGHSGDLLVSGANIRMDSSFFGGTIVLDTDAALSVTGTSQLTAIGTTACACGGIVTLLAVGPVVVDGAGTTIDAHSGSDSFGGEVEITSTTGGVQVLENINADGGSFAGGYVTILAATFVEIAGNIDANAGCLAGFCGCGGEISASAGGPLTVTGTLLTRGPQGTVACGGADGGPISLGAGGDLSVGNTVDASAGIDWCGGAIDISCMGTFTQLPGTTIRNEGRGVTSSGGTIQIMAGGDLLVQGTLNSTGGTDGFAGDVTLDALGDLDITGTVMMGANATIGTFSDVSCTAGGDLTVSGAIDGNGSGPGGEGADISLDAAVALLLTGADIFAQGNSTGFGGAIALSSGVDMQIDATSRIRATGNATGAGGTGGSVAITACDLTVSAGAEVRTRGAPAGVMTVTILDTGSVGGTWEADAGGAINIVHRLPAPPATPGSFNPPAAISFNPGLGPCPIPPPVCMVMTPMGTSMGDIALMADTSSIIALAVDLAFEYSTNGGVTWLQCTAAAGSALANPATAVPVGPAVFTWDSVTDAVALTLLTMGEVRLTVTDGSPMPGVCATAAFAIDNSARCNGICGDCNLNGIGPNILDALEGAQIAAGLVSPSPAQAFCCDADGNSAVSVLDALLMAQAAAGLGVTLSCP